MPENNDEQKVTYTPKQKLKIEVEILEIALAVSDDYRYVELALDCARKIRDHIKDADEQDFELDISVMLIEDIDRAITQRTARFL